MPSRPQHPVVIITGASSGIGAATAHELARRGYAVALAARRADELQRLAGEITAAGGVAIPLPTDLCDLEQAKQLVQLTEAQLGPIDVLINNAGMSISHRAWRPTDEQMQTIFGLNLFAQIQLTRLVAPGMIERKRGHIVNIASVAGYIGTPAHSLYSASKHAMRGWSSALRRELMRHKVHVTIISPGYIRTAMTADARGIPMPGPAVVARAIAKTLRHPQREIVVPGIYKALIWLDRLAPGLVDLALSRV